MRVNKILKNFEKMFQIVLQVERETQPKVTVSVQIRAIGFFAPNPLTLQAILE